MDTRIAYALRDAVNTRLVTVAGTPAELALRSIGRQSTNVLGHEENKARLTKERAQKAAEGAQSQVAPALRANLRDLQYMYLSRPCHHLGEDLQWFVAGGETNYHGGGVLAWCYDIDDANEALDVLRAVGDYTDLKVGNTQN